MLLLKTHRSFPDLCAQFADVCVSRQQKGAGLPLSLSFLAGLSLPLLRVSELHLAHAVQFEIRESCLSFFFVMFLSLGLTERCS